MIITVRDAGSPWPYGFDLPNDNLVILAMLVGPAAAMGARLDEGWFWAALTVLGNLVAALAAAFVIAEVVALLQLANLYRKGYRRAPADIQQVVVAHLKAAGVRRNPFVLWQPTNFLIDGRAIGSFLFSGVALTGGAVVLMDMDADAFRGLVVHEAVHIVNRDIFFTALVVLNFGAALIIVGADDAASWKGCIEFVVKPPFMLAMLFRRELLADAVAVSSVQNIHTYARMVAQGAMRDRFLHPRRSKRVKALESDNPVLRRRAWILLLCAWMIISIGSSLYEAWEVYVREHSADSGMLFWFIWLFLAGSYLPAKAFLAEFGKGNERKVPVPSDALLTPATLSVLP